MKPERHGSSGIWRENESLKAKIAQLENIVKLKSLKDSLDG